MQLKNEISEELGRLSMVIAGIDRKTPYVVPEGYFAGFPGKMLRLLMEDKSPSANEPEVHSEDETPAPGWGKEPAFSVPTGYFEGFASRMMDKIKAQQGEQVQDAREELAGLSPLLSRIDKKMPFQVPAGYFDTLEAVVGEENLSPLMTELKDRSIYQAPEGYFESLPEIVIARIRPAKTAAPARIISMRQTRKVWWQYSAAAVVAGFIFAIGWLRLHTPNNQHGLNITDVSQGLTKISDQDIESYLDNQDNHVAQVQQDDAIGNSIASLEFSDNDIKSFLGDLSDSELKQYMEEHGSIKDYPTN